MILLQCRKMQKFAPIFLVAIALIVLGLPYLSWGFGVDDFGLVWHGKIEALRELGNFFTEIGLHTFMQPSNYIAPEQSFFAVLYRPLLYGFYGVQYLLFGFSPYGYLLVSSLLHGLNAVLVWIVFKRYFSLSVAALGAGYFLFHLSMLNWFGWATAQQHLLALFFTLLIAVLYLRFEVSRNKFLLLPMIVLSCCSLLTRETILVLPLWVAFACIWNWRCVRDKAWLFVSALVPVVGYLGWRVSRFPLKSSEGDLTWVTKPGFAFFAFLKDQFLNYVTWLVDLTNLGFVGGGNRLRKGSLIILVVAFLVWLFFKCRKKSMVLFLFASSIAFAWPAVIRFYTSRFMYEALLFFVAAILLLVFENDLPFKPKAWCFAGLIVFNAAVFPFFLHEREQVLANINTAVKELVVQLKDRPGPICFAGLPFGWFCTSVAQAFYMNGFPETTPIYYDKGAFVWTEFMPDKEPIHMQAKLLSDGILEMRLNKPQKFSFQDRGTNFGTKELFEEGDATVLHWDMHNDRFDIPRVIVIWDYEARCFKILES